MVMSQKIPEELINLFENANSIKVLSTIDENGDPYISFKGSLQILDNNIAYAEIIESSQTNKNMIKSIWFNKHVSIAVTDRIKSYYIKGLPIKCLIDGPIFKQFYMRIREKSGEDSDVQSVWIIEPKDIIEKSPKLRMTQEEEKHPMFKHLDRKSLH